MKQYFSFKRSLLGIDIKSGGLYLAQLKQNKGSYGIERLIFHPLPSNVFVDGKIKEWNELTRHLTICVHEHGLRHTYVAIQIPAHLVRIQRLSLPLGLPDSEIELEVAAHLKRDLPGMTETLCLDFHRLHQDQTHMDVLYIATRAAYLSAYQEAIQKAGLIIKIIDVDIYALQRVVTAYLAKTQQLNSIYALIYIQEETLLFMVVNAREVLFHQYWDVVRGEDIVQQIKAKHQQVLSTMTALEVDEWLLTMSDIRLEREQIVSLEALGIRPYSLPLLASDQPPKSADFWIACGLSMRRVPTW